MSGNTAEVQPTISCSTCKGGQERYTQSWFPVTFKRKNSTHEVRRCFGLIRAASMGNWQAGAVKSADAGHLSLCITNEIGSDSLFRFEDSIDALGRDNRLILKSKDKWRVLAVENNHVYLVAECPLTINDVCSIYFVTLRELGLKQLKPDALACVTLRSRMRKRLTGYRKFLLDIIVQPGKKLFERPIVHTTISFQSFA